MAQFQKVGTKVYGNTPHDVYQRPYNPVTHESSVQVSATNIWDAPSTSPFYNSTLLLLLAEDFKPLRSFFLSPFFFPFFRGCVHPSSVSQTSKNQCGAQPANRAACLLLGAGGRGALRSTAARALQGQRTTAPRRPDPLTARSAEDARGGGRVRRGETRVCGGGGRQRLRAGDARVAAAARRRGEQRRKLRCGGGGAITIIIILSEPVSTRYTRRD